MELSYGDMKIAIDISQLVYGTGVSVYTKRLVENLIGIDKTNEYKLFAGSLRQREKIVEFTREFDKQKNVSSFLCPISPFFADLVWNKLHILNLSTFMPGVDVFHSSDWSQPPSSSFNVTTVHDLTPVKFPKETSSRVVNVHKSRLGWVIKEVDRIIVPSKTTKEDLISLGGQESKIRVIPEAQDSLFKLSSKFDLKEMQEKFNLRDEYFLVVGTSKRKNLDRITESFNKIKDSLVVKKLVIVGEKPKLLKVNKDIIYLGKVATTDLVRLYGGAVALIYVSLYEGFGLPVLEAMACGIPVVASNTSSLPEVGGKACLYVDPLDVDSIAFGMREILRKREEYVKRGKKRIQFFSWKKTARETLDVYREFLLK